ncbi:MAG: hypothetical protein HN936_16690 [Bacteroidetes bacterium]|jgi:hypothetical protein|nr:hypothetical protein [Bacteroidota bacterium]MBT4398531.1 hypothetical protein [Bacteroidota bacterium]MBT4410209.1 hypothetical protein [Bacteroidota bacterium]MBT5427200.1 hypothetical protein [Bacteroidota bacterium]MBT7094886.1 hypothetical protein [Bacteroidota bacterium]
MKKDVKKVISPQGTDPVAVKDPICPKGFGCPFLISGTIFFVVMTCLELLRYFNG